VHRRAEEDEACKELDAVYRRHAHRVVAERHVVFLNCSRHGFIQPKYFNTMRDPVARLVSYYYYSRIREFLLVEQRACVS
jgi:hypothetical protein